jgi:hypothetical protein
LVEADLDIGFCLVDLAESYPADLARLLANAEGVYAEVLARLNRLQPAERGSFQPLVAELRRALDLALPPPA